MTPGEMQAVAPAELVLAESAATEPLPSREVRAEPGNTAAAEPKPKSGHGDPGGDPDLWLYRERTIVLLRHYLRCSVEVGRLPSLLGRELFTGRRISTYRVATFEDAVILVHDVEGCLAKLNEFERKLIARLVFQDYTQDEVARLMGCRRRTVGRRFPEALDRLSALFLAGELLRRLPGHRARLAQSSPGTCQEGKNREIVATCEEQTK